MHESFPMIPARYLDAKLKEHGNLYGSYRDIADTERRYSHLDSPPYSKLKSRRFSNRPSHDDLMHRIKHKEGPKCQKLELELQAAYNKKLKDDGKSHLAHTFHVSLQIVLPTNNSLF